jgi:Fe-S-cluster containining protein
MFPCTKCGICCKSLKSHNLYEKMDRGDGVCIHFNELESLCSIYEDRPSICRIDDMYEQFFLEKMTKEDYFIVNAVLCYEAQEVAGLPKERRIEVFQ